MDKYQTMKNYLVYWLNNDNKFELIYENWNDNQIIEYANLKYKEWIKYIKGKVANKIVNINDAIQYLEKYEDIKIIGV